MPMTCSTGYAASRYCRSMKRKNYHGTCRDHPQWDLETAKVCARDVEAVLASDSYPFFLDAMYGDMPNHWSEDLSGLARLRFITNAFTRMRLLPERAAGYVLQRHARQRTSAAQTVVFCYPRARHKRYSVVFGHWAALKVKAPRRIYGLDTGCCWGGDLTCLRWEDKNTLFSRPAGSWT